MRCRGLGRARYNRDPVTDVMEEFLHSPTGAHGAPARVPPDLSPLYIFVENTVTYLYSNQDRYNEMRM